MYHCQHCLRHYRPSSVQSRPHRPPWFGASCRHARPVAVGFVARDLKSTAALCAAGRYRTVWVQAGRVQLGNSGVRASQHPADSQGCRSTGTDRTRPRITRARGPLAQFNGHGHWCRTAPGRIPKFPAAGRRRRAGRRLSTTSTQLKQFTKCPPKKID
eukprot:767803-Hanusia_phi.AAC.4